VRSVFDTPLGQARLKELDAETAARQKSANVRSGRARFVGVQQRSYAAAQTSRLNADWATPNSSADSELATGLTKMRTRSRALHRDSPYAKRAMTIIVNNIIGCGMRLQAQVKTSRGEFNKRVNDEIEDVFREWSNPEFCHTGGRLCFADMERFLIGQVAEAGEVFVRRHFTAMPGSAVPYALEVIEAERVADELTSPFIAADRGNEIRMGVEIDRFQRPVAYYIRRRHPQEYRFGSGDPDLVERVPANQIIHLARIKRWPQTRGEPWLHAVATTLNDMEGYSEAEITRARTQACINGAIETPEDASSFGEAQEDGSVEMQVEPGTYKRLNPGERLTAGPMNSPNPQYADFMREKKREVAVGVGVNYASLSGDYSQADYSPLRLSLNDDRDSWRDHQQWYVRAFRELVHREWLQQAVFARAIESVSVEAYASDRKRFEAAQFRARAWTVVDPTKENTANKDGVRAGFLTLQDVLVAAGSDIEEYIDQRQRELQMIEAAGLILDTDPKQVSNAGLTQARPVGTTIPLEQDEAVALAKKPDSPPRDPENDSEQNPAPSRVFRFQR
jgi:lambda family phage portal protein